MNKYTYFFLYILITFATGNIHASKENSFKSIAINLHETLNAEALIDDKNDLNISGSAVFKFSKNDNNFLIQNKMFHKNDNIECLIQLLQNDFIALKKCCNSDANDQDVFFDDCDSIGLQQTFLTIDQDNNTVNVNYMESDDKGIDIESDNFINIVHAWKNALRQQSSYIGLIQNSDDTYQIIPFHSKEKADEYLRNHAM